MSWLEWQNVIFLVPLGIGLALAALSGLGIGDVDADADADAGASMDADAEAEADTDSEPHTGAAVLSLLGLGRVPVMLLVTVTLTVFGLAGLAARHLTGSAVAAAPIALATSLVLSGAFARVFARVLPQNETYAASVNDLAGCTGRVVLLSSGTEGFAQVEDPNGNMQEVSCTSVNGRTLTTGQEVVIVRVDSSTRCCLVSPLNQEVSS